jgi:hypothetical protein
MHVTKLELHIEANTNKEEYKHLAPISLELRRWVRWWLFMDESKCMCVGDGGGAVGGVDVVEKGRGECEVWGRLEHDHG